MFWELAFTSDLNFESTFQNSVCTESFNIFQVSSISRQVSFKALGKITQTITLTLALISGSIFLDPALQHR